MSGIIPHASSGRMQGRVVIAGKDVRNTSLSSLSKEMGLVFQSPDDQIICQRLYNEVAFGLENIRLDKDRIPSRVSDALSKMGLVGFENAEIQTLSGGQKQRVAIVAQLAMDHPILAMDEAISQLDPGRCKRGQ
jgi:energy-coupling factor transport system ATP-binding protein